MKYCDVLICPNQIQKRYICFLTMDTLNTWNFMSGGQGDDRKKISKFQNNNNIMHCYKIRCFYFYVLKKKFNFFIILDYFDMKI
jgi:hypothetical protein